METPLIHEEQHAGAQFADYDGCRLPELFSNFEAEYRAAQESVRNPFGEFQSFSIADGRWEICILILLSWPSPRAINSDYFLPNIAPRREAKISMLFLNTALVEPC